MNKAQFVEAIALDANISKIDARKAVDAMIRVTVQSLREGERLTLTGLGTFSVQQKSERVGRNPRTGAAVKIPPRKVIKFRPTAEVEKHPVRKNTASCQKSHSAPSRCRPPLYANSSRWPTRPAPGERKSTT